MAVDTVQSTEPREGVRCDDKAAPTKRLTAFNTLPRNMISVHGARDQLTGVYATANRLKKSTIKHLLSEIMMDME